MEMQYKLVENAQERQRICNHILHALPDWFGVEPSIQGYSKDAESMELMAAYDGDRAVGFVILNQHNPYTAEVHVMGVLEGYHRGGIGRGLVEWCKSRARELGCTFLEVKTLDSTHPDPGYARTRMFYSSMGFLPLESNQMWGEENPCLIMVQVL